MKRFFVFAITIALLLEVGSAQYLTTSRDPAATPSDINNTGQCPNTYRSLAFDLETIDAGTTLDLAIGKTVFDVSTVKYYGFQDYNNGSGSFPSQNGNFIDNTTSGSCNDINRISDVVFGKLRPSLSPQRRDLAVLRDLGIYLYYNEYPNGISSSLVGSISGVAKEGSWGLFSTDDFEDLAVLDASTFPNFRVKIYTNNQGGNLNTTPVMLSETIEARHVLLAQLDDNLYNPTPDNRVDLVTVRNGSIFVRNNTNSNDFGNERNLNWGGNSSDDIHVAVADFNNDGWKDIVAVGSIPAGKRVRLYLSASGTINQTPTWEYSGSDIPDSTQIFAGDLGAPGGIATKNDGFSDFVIVGQNAAVRVFINLRNNTFSQEQSFQAGATGSPSVLKIQLADIENKGGLSLLYSHGTQLYIHKHAVTDPAPAPPKNASWRPSGANPMITWAANAERDLAGYKVYKKASGTPSFVLAATVGLTQTSWTDVNEMYTYNETPLYNEYYIKAYDNATNLSDQSATVSVPIIGNAWKRSANGEQLPSAFALYQNYPNPFNPSTEIKFDLPEDGYVSLNVFDVLGRKVGALVNGNYAAGYHSVVWSAKGGSASGGNASNLASGVYFARFTAADESGKLKFSKITKLVLNK